MRLRMQLRSLEIVVMPRKCETDGSLEVKRQLGNARLLLFVCCWPLLTFRVPNLVNKPASRPKILPTISSFIPLTLGTKLYIYSPRLTEPSSSAARLPSRRPSLNVTIYKSLRQTSA